MRIVGPEQRQRHVAEDLPAARAVDQRCLLELARDLLQPGQVEDHVEAEVLPRDRDEHRVEDDAGVREPFALNRQDAVGEPAGLEHQREDDAGDDFAEHERREVQDAQQRAALAACALSMSATPSANGSWSISESEDEDGVVPQRAGEDGVAERALEVLQPDEVVELAEPVPLEPAEVHRLDDGRDDQQQVQRQRGREEERDRRPAAPGARATRPADGGRHDEGAGRRVHPALAASAILPATSCGDALPANSSCTASLTAWPTAGAYA